MERGDESVSASTYHRAAQYLGISLDEALAEAEEDAPLGCNVRRGAGTGENNILAAYKHENGLSLRNLAEILGSNYTTVMYDCRNESCRPYFVAILAENEGLTVGEFMRSSTPKDETSELRHQLPGRSPGEANGTSTACSYVSPASISD